MIKVILPILIIAPNIFCADDSKAPDSPRPESPRTATAKRLVTLTFSPEETQAMVNSVSQGFNKLKADLNQEQQELLEERIKATQAHLKSDEFKSSIAEIYKETFTVEELVELERFMGSPIYPKTKIFATSLASRIITPFQQALTDDILKIVFKE